MSETERYGEQANRSNQRNDRQNPATQTGTPETDARIWRPGVRGRAAGGFGTRRVHAHLEEVVRRNDKQRFAFDEMGERIRAGS